MMAETKKHDIVEHTCANCAYWEGQRLIDQASGISFINPNERATCSNQASPESNKKVTPAHTCNHWAEAL